MFEVCRASDILKLIELRNIDGLTYLKDDSLSSGIMLMSVRTKIFSVATMS
jgi:hypothetical protein